MTKPIEHGRCLCSCSKLEHEFLLEDEDENQIILGSDCIKKYKPDEAIKILEILKFRKSGKNPTVKFQLTFLSTLDKGNSFYNSLLYKGKLTWKQRECVENSYDRYFRAVRALNRGGNSDFIISCREQFEMRNYLSLKQLEILEKLIY